MKLKVCQLKRLCSLTYTPVLINGYFLIPLEFLIEGLKIKIEEIIPVKDTDLPECTLVLKIFLEDRIIEIQSKNSISLLLINNSTEKKVLDFNTVQIFEIIINDKKGNIVYNWSKYMRFTQVGIFIKLEPGKSRLFETFKVATD